MALHGEMKRLLQWGEKKKRKKRESDGDVWIPILLESANLGLLFLWVFFFSSSSTFLTVKNVCILTLGLRGERRERRSEPEAERWIRSISVCASSCKQVPTASRCGLKTVFFFFPFPHLLCLLSVLSGMRWMIGLPALCSGANLVPPEPAGLRLKRRETPHCVMSSVHKPTPDTATPPRRTDGRKRAGPAGPILQPLASLPFPRRLMADSYLHSSAFFFFFHNHIAVSYLYGRWLKINCQREEGRNSPAV